MAIKAIALDIDGTLTNDEKVVTARTREALLAAQRSGVRLVCASGTQGVFENNLFEPGPRRGFP